MRQSEFWEALELAFGAAQGRFLAQDLFLTSLDGTAVEALDRGVPPGTVWKRLIEESGADSSVEWIHRRARRRVE